MATCEEVLRELEALGSDQTRKTYLRHGAGENTYGVSYANFGLLKKRFKQNQALAEQLWASGNHDARILALMIADPPALTPALLQNWATDLHNYSLSDALAGLVAQTHYADELMRQWIDSDAEWIERAGWHVLSARTLHDASLSEETLAGYLQRIERNIHSSKNWVRHAMNDALIAIGMRNDRLEQQAIAAAERIGKVHVDHGDTSCKTPAAVPYILKARARQQQRSA